MHFANTNTAHKTTKSKVATALPIPRSYEECGPADKALVDMRDAGETWKAVNVKWAELTGSKAALVYYRSLMLLALMC
jgi:hypothetical protein